MIVYVKTFNRPFYLDRCLQSLKALGRGIDKIVVLDDGTEQVYLESLAARYPDIDLRRSGSGDEKWALVRQQGFEEIKARFVAPHAFWLREIHADAADYMCILEDDTWLTRSLDFRELARHMRAQKAGICRLFWGDAASGPSQQAVGVKALRSGTGLVLETARPRTIDEVWGFFLVCMSVYERGFYELAHAGVQDYLDESAILQNVKNDFDGNALPRLVARLTQRAVCQGWAIPGRSDVKYYAMGVAQHVFVDLFNRLWLAGEFDPLRDYPRDFDLDWLCELFTKHLPAEAVAAYRLWRQNDPGARAFAGLATPTRLEVA